MSQRAAEFRPDADAATQRWQVRVLGALELSDGQTVVRDFGGRAMEALFARLAMWPGRAVARETLIELLWPGVEIDIGRNRLRNALAVLRRALESARAGALLRATRNTVRLDLPEQASDLARIDAALAAGVWSQAHEPCGELLPGHMAGWVVDERDRLAGRLATRHDAAPAAGPPAIAVRLAEPHPLPASGGRFFGRESEIALLRSWLAAERLVSIVGPGGSGKSRLALEVARAWVARRVAAFVALADCDAVGQIPERIIAAWKVPATHAVMQACGDGEWLEPVVSVLAGQPALLVLDNLEPFDSATLAGLVAALLERLPELRIVATSRRPIDLAGERVLWLEGLALPGDAAPLDSPALQMLVDRARALRHDHDWLGPDLPALVDLCALVDGAPLAIELAAAQLDAQSPAQLCSALRSGRARLGRDGSAADAHTRHASIDATLRWSVDRLDAGTAQAFASLAVFRGSFDAEAARAVCGPTAGDDALDALVTHSLLQRHFAHDGGTRYSMLHLVRAFARQRAGDAEAARLRQAHRDWVRALVERTPRTALHVLVAEDANLREAIASAAGDACAGDAVAIGAALAPYFERHGVAPATLDQLCAAVTSAHGDEAGLHDLILALAELLLNGAGRPEQAADWAERALRSATDARGRSLALYMKARIAWARTLEPGALRPLLTEALALARTCGSADAEARALWILGPVLRRLDRDPAGAEDCYRHAAVLFEQSDNPIMANRMLYLRANCALQLGHNERALSLHETCAVRCRELGDRIGLMRQRNEQGVALLQLERWRDASEAFAETIELAWLHNHRYLLVFGLFNLPQAAVHRGRAPAACRLLGFACQRWQRHVGPMNAAVQGEADRTLAVAGATLGTAARALADAGSGLDWHEAVALARQLAS